MTKKRNTKIKNASSINYDLIKALLEEISLDSEAIRCNLLLKGKNIGLAIVRINHNMQTNRPFRK